MSRLHPIPRFFLSLALGLAAAFGVQAREMVSVQRAEVNLRAGAGTQHEALWVLSRGYPLEVTGRKGQWLKVRDFENDTGWIFRPLVGKKAHHVVKGSVVNLRSSPSTRSRIVGKATRGEVLRTLDALDAASLERKRPITLPLLREVLQRDPTL